jgi:hypothetical protein
MPKPRAEELAERFFSLFGAERIEYFTNTVPWLPSVYERAKAATRTGLLVIREDEVDEMHWGERGDAWVGSGLTSSTFDTGLVVVGPRQAGILWFEDED